MKADIEILAQTTEHSTGVLQSYRDTAIVTPTEALEAMRLAVEQANEWVSVETDKPKDIKPRLASYKSGTINIKAICQYTKGGEIETEIEDLPEDEQFLSEGWYELVEQIDGYYDFSYLKREVTHWMPLPSAPPIK